MIVRGESTIIDYHAPFDQGLKIYWPMKERECKALFPSEGKGLDDYDDSREEELQGIPAQISLMRAFNMCKLFSYMLR